MTRQRHPVVATAAAASLLILAVGLAGCGAESGPGSSRADTRRAVSPGASGAQPPEENVRTLIQQAALPPCPTSSDQPAVEGGLPRHTFSCVGDGPAVALSGLRGRPLVVNVWASWCPPCAQEMPHLVEAKKAVGDQVTFLGIDLENTREQGLAWARDLKMNFPSVLDPDGEVKPGLRLLGPPITLFVRADGTIAYRHQGPLTGVRQIADLMQQHLGVRAV